MLYHLALTLQVGFLIESNPITMLLVPTGTITVCCACETLISICNIQRVTAVTYIHKILTSAIVRPGIGVMEACR